MRRPSVFSAIAQPLSQPHRQASAARPLVRLVLGIGGGYLVSLGFTAFFGLLLGSTGLASRADAAVYAGMAAFLAWTFAVIIAFGAASTTRAAAWILGSAALLTLGAWSFRFLTNPLLGLGAALQ